MISVFTDYIHDQWDVKELSIDEEADRDFTKCTIVRKVDSNIDELLSDLGKLQDYLSEIWGHHHDADHLAKDEFRYVFTFPKKQIPNLEAYLFGLIFDKELEEALSEQV